MDQRLLHHLHPTAIMLSSQEKRSITMLLSPGAFANSPQKREDVVVHLTPLELMHPQRIHKHTEH